MSPPRVFVLILHSTNSNNTNCWTVCSARRPLTLIAMPKRKITKKQQPITELALPLLKKPLEQIGKQINVPGSYWEGRMSADERVHLG